MRETDEKIYWICLSKVFGPASHHLRKLMSECETAKEAYQRITSGKFPLTPGEKKQLDTASPDHAYEICRLCDQKNISVYTYSDEGYPSKLKTIYDPPAVLYVSGNEKCLNEDMTIAVVGTRNCTVYGEKAAGKISEELAKTGFTIVSGFAAGIDSAAHRAAVMAGGRTIAVLGCGIDIDYPKCNSDIREAVMKNGVFVSEFPPGTPPLGKNFPLRNRIISGLSLGVFVAEAPLSSGALITADIAIEQGRDVFCLPPYNIFDKNCQGVVKYLRDGAVPVFSHLDIIYEYYTNFTHKLSSVKPSDEYASSKTDSLVYKKAFTEKTPASTEEPAGIDENLQLTDEQHRIAECLSGKKLYIEDICQATGFDMQTVLTELTELEMEDIVVSLPGKIYTLSKKL